MHGAIGPFNNTHNVRTNSVNLITKDKIVQYRYIWLYGILLVVQFSKTMYCTRKKMYVHCTVCTCTVCTQYCTNLPAHFWSDIKPTNDATQKNTLAQHATIKRSNYSYHQVAEPIITNKPLSTWPALAWPQLLGLLFTSHRISWPKATASHTAWPSDLSTYDDRNLFCCLHHRLLPILLWRNLSRCHHHHTALFCWKKKKKRSLKGTLLILISCW